MKAVFQLILVVSESIEPVFAGLDADCPFSKKGVNHEASTEKVKNSEPSN